MSTNEERVTAFLTEKLGLDKEKHAKKIKDTISNKKISRRLLAIESEISNFDNESILKASNFIYDLASRFPDEADFLRPTILKWIIEGDVKGPQLEAIFDFTKKNLKSKSALDLEIIKKECGVGVVVEPEEITETVSKLLKSKEKELKEKRYQLVSSLHASLRQSLKWADRSLVSAELNKQLLETLGPKGENELQKSSAKKEKEFRFPDPSENVQLKPEILEKHLKETGGKVITRFPPEPNGYLHIGHAKAMNLNFGYANMKNGICYLRFDDTNPEAESQEYIDSIIDTVEWLGHKPVKITYASDYFEELFEFGVQLIKMGKAFVCHQKPEEYKSENNPNAKTSPWRDRPIEESLKLFADMRAGKFKEGEATLRMKMDIENPNPCLWDLVAFRIKYHPHPRTGDKYCVYPTYDFTHCINDSLENITHSLCTLEYVVRQDSYYWLVDTLGLYRSFVWEYGRLFITHTVLSKRRLIKLVNGGYVRGWDDPRMPTLVGFKRRGYTADAINKFCDVIGVTRSDNVVVEYSRLENCLRNDLERKAKRAMAILDPIKVVISNFTPRKIERKNIPADPNAGTNEIILTNTIYIDRKDFREEDVPEFFGLALKTENNEPKWVRLKYGPLIAVTDAKRDNNGEIIELNAIYDDSNRPSKGTIHWVSFKEDGSEPDTAEIRLYSHLFKSEKPFKLDDWISDINPDSLKVIKGYIDPTLTKAEIGSHYQFERIGYFYVDPDTKPGSIVFNLSTTLKESKEVKNIK